MIFNRFNIIMLNSFITLILLSWAGTGTPADEDLIVKGSIPEFPSSYDHPIYAGYLNLTVFDKAFYYFLFMSQSGHESDPLLVWLNGGPGCSSLGGMTSENGPFVFETNSTKMKINQNAWNKNAHVLYLQSPAGVGFSKGKPESLITNDTGTARDNLLALMRFFEKFPSLKANDFYLSGESYAGIYVPRLAQEIVISNSQEGSEEKKINLKGILLGNACTHPTECYTAQVSRYRVEFYYSRGFIDDAMYSLYKASCSCETCERLEGCQKVQEKIRDFFFSSGANVYNVFGRCYHPVYPPQFEVLMENPKHSLKCTDSIGALYLFNKNQNRAALHVQELNDTLFWTPCSDSIKYTVQSKASYSTLPVLVKEGLKIMYFSGDVDSMVPIQGTLSWFQRYRNDFGASVKKNWRPWITNDKRLAGMVWQLQGLTFVSVVGAGHMVPTDKPMQAEYILNVFLGRVGWVSPEMKNPLEVE